MNTNKPQKGIAVTDTGLICQCGNTDESRMLDHVEVISRSKDIYGKWSEKTKDFLKCGICGELEPLEEAFVQARIKLHTTNTPVQVCEDIPDWIGTQGQGIITNDIIKEEIAKKDAKVVESANLDHVSMKKDGTLKLGLTDVEYEKPKKKRKYNKRKKN